MALYALRPKAEADLLEIWLFIARDSPGAADRLLDRIEAQCRLLADNPLLGRARPEIAPDARSESGRAARERGLAVRTRRASELDLLDRSRGVDDTHDFNAVILHPIQDEVTSHSPIGDAVGRLRRGERPPRTYGADPSWAILLPRGPEE